MATTAAEGKGARLIRSFGQPGCGDVAFAGGKGAGLGDVRGAGAIPPGSVVGARAYDAAERRVLLDAARTTKGGAR